LEEAFNRKYEHLLAHSEQPSSLQGSLKTQHQRQEAATVIPILGLDTSRITKQTCLLGTDSVKLPSESRHLSSKIGKVIAFVATILY